jgi:serine/threonine protein kinase
MSTFSDRFLWYSSAKDQLTGQSVAVKKIMKPFSTPVLSKRTYRELKLLKHLRHENVSRTNFMLLAFLPYGIADLIADN